METANKARENKVDDLLSGLWAGSAAEEEEHVMIHIMALYQVKEGKLTETISAVEEFVDAVKDNEPGTLVYEAVRGKDDLSFFHVMTFQNEEAEEFHRSTPHMSKFAETLSSNCQEEPVFVELDLVRSNIR